MPTAYSEEKAKRIIEAKGKNGWIEAWECAEAYSKEGVKKIAVTDERKVFYRWFKNVRMGRVKGFQVFCHQGYIPLLGLESADTKTADALKRKWNQVLVLPKNDYHIISREGPLADPEESLSKIVGLFRKIETGKTEPPDKNDRTV